MWYKRGHEIEFGIDNERHNSRDQTNSPTIPAIRVSRCAVGFYYQSVSVEWHFIKDKCEPVLAGKKAEHLGIIKLKKQTGFSVKKYIF